MLYFYKLFIFLIGLFARFTSSMFGIGGGSIRTPLFHITGLLLLTAYAINFFVIPFFFKNKTDMDGNWTCVFDYTFGNFCFNKRSI